MRPRWRNGSAFRSCTTFARPTLRRAGGGRPASRCTTRRRRGGRAPAGAPVAGLPTDNGAATLTAFTARSIAKGVARAGGAGRIVIAGGGSHNPPLLATIAEAASTPVVTADELGWSADFLEAEAFAFLA